MSNRVEQLEHTVSELESTIEGLTGELVDTKERLRVLESQLDVDACDYVEVEERTPAKEAEPDDVEAAVEEDKAEGTQESENADESGSGLGDDIIVA